MKVFASAYIWEHLVFSEFLNFAKLMGIKWYLILLFNLHLCDLLVRANILSSFICEYKFWNACASIICVFLSCCLFSLHSENVCVCVYPAYGLSLYIVYPLSFCYLAN